MFGNNLYYIYIDTKIKGTIDQLVSYFQTLVFHVEDCICIYFKFYKNIEKYILKKFKNLRVSIKFIKKKSDLVLKPEKVVFYLFNAQSNCGVVARRELTHIFVTHGESHKLASIKPIIRIYDFIITSGQVGIDRYLKSGVFNNYNISVESRVLKMGDTFIGQNPYVYSENSDAFLYAPTWEGGLPSENFSSIGFDVQLILEKIIDTYNYKKIYIQLHPNLGHRDSSYLKKIQEILKFLKNKAEVVLVKTENSLKDYFIYSHCKILRKNYHEQILVNSAIVDISAMEMQLINKSIPTIVLYKKEHIKILSIPKKIKNLYDDSESIENLNIDSSSLLLRSEEIYKHKNYLISYDNEVLAMKKMRERIVFLCEYAIQKKIEINRKITQEL